MIQPTRPHIVATFEDSFVRCGDCLSVVVMVAHDDQVCTVQVQHSLTCPCWRHPRAEVVATFLPKTEERSNEDDQ